MATAKTRLSDILNYIFVIIAFSPLFTVYIFSENLVNGRYTAKTFYFYFVTLVIFSIVAIYFLFNKKTLKIQLSKLDLAILAFCFYGFVRMIFTPNLPFLNTRFLTHSMLLGLYFLWKYLFTPVIPRSGFSQTKESPELVQLNRKIFLLILLLVGMGQAIYGLLQLYNILPVPPNIGGFRVFGNFGNPSPYGSFLGPFIPLSLGVYLLTEEEAKSAADSLSSLLKNVGLLTFLLTLLVIPATNSRSAWVSAAVGMVIILEYKYQIFKKFRRVFLRKPKAKSGKPKVEGIKQKNKKQETDTSKSLFNQIQDDKSNSRTLRPLRLSIFIILLLSIILSGSILLYNYKKDSAFGRILQWKITMNMIQDKPIFGHGFNSFGLHYNDYQAEYFAAKERPEQEIMIAGNTQQAHNDYLEIVTELGVIGFFLFIFVLFFVFRNYLYIRKKQKIITIIAFGGLMAFFVECLFTYPLQILPSLVIIVGLFSLIDHNPIILRSGFSPTKESQKYREQNIKEANESIKIASVNIPINRATDWVIGTITQKLTALILLTIISILALTQHKNYKAHKKWNIANNYSYRQQYNYSLGMYKVLYSTSKNNGSFLLNYGGTLVLAEKYSEAIPILKEAGKYINDPNLFINLGNCYNENTNFNLAQKYYRRAEMITPHQMYQKYLLAKLYYKNDRIESFKLKASEILNMKVKINSTAIFEMQEEVRNLVESLNLKAKSR